MEEEKNDHQKLNNARNACYINAESHLKSAELLISGDQYSDAYHHATMALEEVGKAELLVMDWMANTHDRDGGFKNWMDDHIKKLFWSLWGPSFGRELITNDQIQIYQGLARNIHETRLGSLYVDVTGDESTIVMIDEKGARNLIDLTKARLELSKARGPIEAELSEDRKEILNWFLEASGHADKRKFIFSGFSNKKLSGSGDMWVWVTWLYDEWHKQEKERIEFAQRELIREFPEESEKDDPKWKMRIRLHCPSHSIRRKELVQWNDFSEWIKLEAVDKRPHELIVDFILPKSFSVKAFWGPGLWMVRRFLSALNIGSMGFFWFHIAEYTAAFYDSIVDLEANTEVRIERDPALEFNWGNQVLNKNILVNVSMCFAGLPEFNERKLFAPFDWYNTGIACLAKTDVHVPMVVDAFRGFYFAWKTGQIQDGSLTEDSDHPTELGNYIAEIDPSDEDVIRYPEFARGIESGNPDLKNITLNEVGCMKVLCDLTLTTLLKKRAEAKFEAENSSGESHNKDEDGDDPLPT